MKYMIGCNYWGSKYGTDMWKYWDEDSVRKDLELVSQYGVSYMRVFPNWRDFQPIHLVQQCKGEFQQYRFADDKKIDNEFGLDMEQIEHFRTFCRMAQANNIKLVVSIVTGWMSGRLFVPPALERLNHITDPESLMWQTRLARGLVRYLKDEPAIVAWDLGNECNCLGVSPSRNASYLWTATIRNAILSEDHTRMIMSGMHGLGTYSGQNRMWFIQDQAELTDVLTPHPYPSPSVGGDVEPINRLRTTLIPTTHVALYSGVGHKPAMMQEIGTFSNTVGNEKIAADSVRVNLFSGWANGSLGYFWWCAYDQKHLTNPPYCMSMIENELGLFRADFTPKDNAFVMKAVNEALSNMPFGDLPAAEVDAVCIIPTELDNYYDQVGATYILGKQAGINVTFATCDQELPEAPIYIVPTLMGWSAITQEMYAKLVKKAEAGAAVYMSTGTGFISEIEDKMGLESLGMINSSEIREADFGTFKVPFEYDKKFLFRSVDAEVLCQDDDGTVIFSKKPRGKGAIYFLNFPLETVAWNQADGFVDHPYYKIYQIIAKDVLAKKPVVSKHPDIILTVHPVDEKRSIIVAINYSDRDLPLDIELHGSRMTTVYYGNDKTIPSCDATVFEVMI